MAKSEMDRITWYIEHRLEYLGNRLAAYRRRIEHFADESFDGGSFDYEALKAYLETRGRIGELQNILNHLKSWS